jgi:hypothetical protein
MIKRASLQNPAPCQSDSSPTTKEAQMIRSSRRKLAGQRRREIRACFFSENPVE